MKRDEFLTRLGLGMALACGACMAGCARKEEDPAGPAGYLLRADLSRELLAAGHFKTGNGILLVRIGTTTDTYAFLATESRYAGQPLTFNLNLYRFECPDGSTFSTAGIVLNGPAAENLKMFTIQVSGALLYVLPPGVAAPKPVPISFNIDLSLKLKAIGDQEIVGQVIVMRLGAGNNPASFAALSSICTHQGSVVGYQPVQNQLVCPTHGSTFSVSGDVVRGPAAMNLKQYKVAVSQHILSVSES